jgi:diguanylate cyclase (GGDEF)-like protein
VSPSDSPDPVLPAARLLTWALACLGPAVLGVWAVGHGLALVAVAAGCALGLAVGLIAGLRAGRRSLARDAGRLLDLPLPGEAPAPADADEAGAGLPSTEPEAQVAPELRPLAQTVRALRERQQALFAAQAAQLEQWRQQAHADPLTGLPNRRHFTAMLDAVLADGTLPDESGLLLLRLHDLQGMNVRVGHAAADRALLAVAEALQAYPDRNGRCVAGRLGGAEFGLLLPVGGLARETATALAQALQRPLAAIDAQARVVIGAVDLLPPHDATVSLALNAGQALALADAELSRVEAGNRALADVDEVVSASPVSPTAPPPAPSWQRRITRALDQDRVALAAFPVRTADGRQLHLDCPLRVQLRPGGPMEPASRWLALVTRSRLCAAVDERAVALALQAIADDSQARCVNIAAQSVAAPGFVAAVAMRLEQAPDAACRLWIDLPEQLALERPLLVRDVARRWRALGAMLGLEHAGEGLARIPGLIDLGLDCVRIDGRFVNGITGPGAVDARRHLQGLVRLVQAVGLQVTAEGVRDAADLEALWQLGFDAATGPAVSAPLPMAPAPAAVAVGPAVTVEHDEEALSPA